MMMGGGGGMHMMFMGSGGREKKRPTIAMYRRLLRFVQPYRRNLVLAAALLILSTVLSLLWPQVVLRVLDAGLKDAALLDTLVLALIGLLLFRAAIDGVRQYVMAWTGERVIFDLRMEIVRHLQSLSLSFFTRRKTGELMSHVTSDATLVHGVVTQTIISVLGQVMTLVGGLVVIFIMNWRLALLTLVVAPPIGLLGQYLGRRIRAISREAQDAQGDAVGVLQEAIAEVRTVQAFTREQYESDRFRTKLLITLSKVLQRARLSATLFPLIGFLGIAASIVVLWYGGHQVIRGEATTGELVAFLLYAGMVAGPVGGSRRTVDAGPRSVRRGRPDLRAPRHRAGDLGPSRSDGAPDRRRPHRVRGRLVPVRAGPARAHRRHDDVRRREDHGPRRPVGRREDDAGQPRRAVLRPDGGPHHARRPRPARSGGALGAGEDRGGATGADPVRDDGRGKHPLRPA